MIVYGVDGPFCSEPALRYTTESLSGWLQRRPSLVEVNANSRVPVATSLRCRDIFAQFLGPTPLRENSSCPPE